ncbi:hypothetical protein ACGF3G_00475 [Streptomyces sp. NPDC048179]|uniref:hypothetical protein n=1 Tax=Streptomyces sp. NPDC048179 TaxID=3365506 RepID=UPI00371CB652
MIPEQQQAAVPAVVYSAPAAGAVVPYAAAGVPAVQSVLLPDGRVVTGYAMAAAPDAPAPAVVERRGIDPTAQKMAAGGVLAVGLGVGGSFLLDALAAAETGLGLLLGCMVVGGVLARGRGGRGGGGGSIRVDVQVNPTITTAATAKVQR